MPRQEVAIPDPEPRSSLERRARTISLRKIVCATDLASGAERAVAHAVALARSCGAEEIRVAIAGAPRILREAKELQADAIVLETYARTGLGRVLGDSIAEDVIRTSPIPVLTIPTGARDREHARAPSSILCGIDLDGDAIEIVSRAAALARLTGADLHVVHVWRMEQGVADRDLSEELDRLVRACSRRGSVVVPHLRHGGAAAEIVELASELDVSWIVIGTRRRGGLSQWLLGSVAEEVVRASPIPVWTFRTGRAER